MGYFKTNYFTDESGNVLAHSANKKHAEYGTMNSTSSDKGTDNKKNNTSQYNHEYYMRNKEKWADNKEWSKDDKDFDENNYNEKNLIPGTDLYSFKNKDGKTVILFEDHKWVLPAGAELDGDMKKRLKELFAGNVSKDDVAKVSSVINAGKTSGEKEFDVDAAARDVIKGKYKNGAERKAALGDDYAEVQKRVNELMKGQKSSSKKTEEKKKDNELRTYEQAREDYNKKKKNLSHSDDLGSVLVRDLY